MKFLKNDDIRNALFIGGLCSLSYLAVYIARNILSAVTPQMIGSDGFTTEYIGAVSSLYFIFYAVGQLINGIVGDKIKARYMISFGLLLAGICNFLFPYIAESANAAKIIYSVSGFFLSMIYAPMTKVVAENTTPIYTIRCSMGYTFASFFGSPLAGAMAALFVWQSVFQVGSVILLCMGTVCFFFFLYMEKKGIVRYHQYDRKEDVSTKDGVKILVQRRIIKFTLISIITGIVRTTVVFWLPTYISQYLGFSAETSAAIFTAASFLISFTTFITIFVYERLNRNMDLTIFLAFALAAISFLLVFFIKMPVLNIVLMVVAIMSSNGAASMLWSLYCPSLRDTGMVSSATGFLDFVSYMAAAASSTIFANAVTNIGWGNLILVWFGLMVLGVVIAMPMKRRAVSE